MTMPGYLIIVLTLSLVLISTHKHVSKVPQGAALITAGAHLGNVLWDKDL